jgi:hypothetical protein
VKFRLPRKAQPVPPIFQPEVAAEAILWAVQHDRREMYVGMSTVHAIVGDKIASGLLDHYLARTGYEAQQTDKPDDANRPHNLWNPVPGDYGARGSFDDRANDHSLQLWANKRRAVGLRLLRLQRRLASGTNDDRSDSGAPESLKKVDEWAALTIKIHEFVRRPAPKSSW